MGELRAELCKVFVDLRNGSIDIKEAAECNNTAGKIINSFRAEVEHAALLIKTPAMAGITATKFIEESK